MADKDASDNECASPLFGELDKLFEKNVPVSLNDFWDAITMSGKDEIFPTDGIGSVFAVLCTDETQGYKIVTKRSFERAKKVFKLDPKHSGAADKIISNIFPGSIEEIFFGFISEDVAKKILLPNRWLVRCDDEGFVITRSVPPTEANPDAEVDYENYRVSYDENTDEYIWYFKDEVLRSNDWEPIAKKMRTLSRDTYGSPLLNCCNDSIIYNWREGEPDIINIWLGLVSGQYDYIFCFRWFVAAIPILDPHDFFHNALNMAFDRLYDPNHKIDAINVCVQHGADLNSTKYCPLYRYACSTSHDNTDAVANHIWRLGADPNAKKDGVPVFFVAAEKKDRAHLFMRNPKLDINIEDKNGHNVAWHCRNKIDLAVFNDKNLNIHQVKDGKTLLDIGIEVFDVQYILKLISAGISVKIPSATKQGTYLHAFLMLSKKGKDDEIISVIRAMIEAGIDVQELNSLYQTPLHIAAALSTPAVVRALIVHYKANPNGHRESDSTPLHIAAERGDTEIVKTLLELGADQFIRNARAQLPREVALYAVKAIFGKGETLPEFKFKAIKVAVTNPMHPQFQANVAIYNDYLYTEGGMYQYFDWWDDYGYMTIDCFSARINTFTRLPIKDILDNSKERTWEEISFSPMIYQPTSSTHTTFFKVNDTFWFNGEKEYVIFHPDTKEYTKGPPKENWHLHNHVKYPHINFYENKIMALRYEEILFIDKTTGTRDLVKIDRGDFFAAKDGEGMSGEFGIVVTTYLIWKWHVNAKFRVLLDNIYWFVAHQKRNVLYAMNIDQRRIFKVFEFNFDLWSSVVCFGNRFIITTVIQNEVDLRLFILDTETMQYSLHEIDFAVDPEKDFNIREDAKTSRQIVKGTEERYNAEVQKAVPIFANKKLPVICSSLIIYQSTLLIHGGLFGTVMAVPYLMAVDLSQLVPYLSLEQHCALAISKNNDKIDKERLKLVSDDLKVKIGL